LSKVQIAKAFHSKQNPPLDRRPFSECCGFGVEWPGRANRAHSAFARSGPPSAASFQGSVPKGTASAQTIDLSLDDAIARGLQANLGIILSGTQTAGARLSA